MLRTILLRRRYWDRIEEQRRRRAKGVLYQYRVAPPPDFIDYWGDIPATKPEKFVFAELVRRGVGFYFSYLFGDIPWTPDERERFRPDFMLPDYRIIIEVQGAYWHTRPGMFEHDRVKFGFYEAAGWSVRIITDQEILDDVVGAIDRHVPEIVVPNVRSGLILIGDRPINPVAALTARIRRYPKVVRLRYRKRIRGPVGVRSAHEPSGRRPRAAFPALDPLFTGWEGQETYLKEVRDFGTAWSDYIDQLGVYFSGPDAGARKVAYPDDWAYYRRWKDWYGRFKT